MSEVSCLLAGSRADAHADTVYGCFRKAYFAIGSRNAEPASMGEILPLLRTVATEVRKANHVGEVRKQVLEANLELVSRGLVLYTFGNASAISREDGLIVIKPSGVPYADMRPEHMVITDLGGRIVEGDLRPSSDLRTHLVLYREFRALGGIVHTHSHYATVWAQACREIPCLGTTHSDYFHGPIPSTPHMDSSEIEEDYEWNTGKVIIRRFKDLDPVAMPGGSRRRARSLLLGTQH